MPIRLLAGALMTSFGRRADERCLTNGRSMRAPMKNGPPEMNTRLVFLIWHQCLIHFFFLLTSKVHYAGSFLFRPFKHIVYRLCRTQGGSWRRIGEIRAPPARSINKSKLQSQPSRDTLLLSIASIKEDNDASKNLQRKA